MQNYVISLKSALERRQHIELEFSKNNIEFNFFDAITPDQAQQIAENLFPMCDLTYLSPVELACFISHIAVWQKAKSENQKYFGIFEDDIFLSKDSAQFLKSSDWISQDCKVIKIETFLEKVFLSGPTLNVFDRKLQRLNFKHFGAAGYILSVDAVDLLIRYIQNSKKIVPIDWYLFLTPIEDNAFQVFQLVPAICIQDKILNEDGMFDSFLESSRVQFEAPKLKLNVSQKIIRELRRVLFQLRVYFFARIIPFK